MTERYVRVSKAADILGVSKITIRRWANSGKISHQRLPSGHRIIDVNSVIKHNDIAEQKERSIVFVYSRVSSNKQRDDLERQRSYVRKEAEGMFGQGYDYQDVHDIASGLNFKRKGLFRILDAVKEERVHAIVVASKDRLARFGFDLISWICNEYATDIVVLDKAGDNATEELGKDLLSIIQIYCCKWNGRRRYTKSNENLQTPPVSDSSTETKT